jgi:hypothetical protein
VRARSECPACASTLYESYFATISPWVRELAGVEERSVSLRSCLHCGSAWFSHAYSDSEMDLLYSNYRGSTYTAVRSHWEPWYDEGLNRGLSDDHGVRRSRVEGLKKFLSTHLSPADLSVVVDVGGDRGQYIPFGDKRFVADPSQRTLEKGVIRVDSAAEVNSPDLIMSCHLLEHLSDPMTELEAYSHARWVYVEVPSGTPNVSMSRRASTYLSYVLAASPALWRRIARPAAGRSSGLRSQPLRLSEHVNFFTPAGIETLMRNAGLDVVGVQTASIASPDGGEVEVLQALGARSD